MTPLWSDENDDLAVTIYADASADIRDKHTNTRWRMGRVALQEEGPVDIGHVWLRTTRSICEQYPGRFRGEAIGDTLRFTLLGREGRMVGQFTCRVRLDGLWLELQIGDINETLPSLVFPPPIESESLVLPINVGRWVRAPLAERRVWMYPGHLKCAGSAGCAATTAGWRYSTKARPTQAFWRPNWLCRHCGSRAWGAGSNRAHCATASRAVGMSVWQKRSAPTRWRTGYTARLPKKSPRFPQPANCLAGASWR
jgi:hypothetical protein